MAGDNGVVGDDGEAGDDEGAGEDDGDGGDELDGEAHLRSSLSRNSLGTSSTYFVNQKTNVQVGPINHNTMIACVTLLKVHKYAYKLFVSVNF